MQATRIHVNPQTGPARCSASVRACPYQHFDTMQDALSFYDDFLQENYGTFIKLSKNSGTSSFRSNVNKTNREYPLEWVDYDEDELNEYDKTVVDATKIRISNSIVSEIEITKDLQKTLSKGVRLDGLEFRLKSPISTARKITNNLMEMGYEPNEIDYKMIENSANSLNDIIRYTYTVENHDDLTGFIKKQSEEFSKMGYTPKKVKNAYFEGNSYKGFSIIWVNQKGESFEVQYQSEKSSRIKEASHEFYEIFRDTAKYDQTTRKAAEAKCVELYKDLEPPKGIHEISEIAGIKVQETRYDRL